MNNCLNNTQHIFSIIERYFTRKYLMYFPSYLLETYDKDIQCKAARFHIDYMNVGSNIAALH